MRMRHRLSRDIDLFMHDSDHWYGWVRFELDAAVRYMAPDGCVLCDDADFSLAFLDKCLEIGAEPRFLVQDSDVFGIALLSARPRSRR